MARLALDARSALVEEETNMKSDKWFRARAKELYYRDGVIEVDSNARISFGDDEGAYVEAWVWVPFEVKNKATRRTVTRRAEPCGTAEGRPALPAAEPGRKTKVAKAAHRL